MRMRKSNEITFVESDAGRNNEYENKYEQLLSLYHSRENTQQKCTVLRTDVPVLEQLSILVIFIANGERH